MKKTVLACTVFLLLLTASYRSACALELCALELNVDQPSIWIHLASPFKAPTEFQEMWLMWPLIREVNNLKDLTLELYAPADSGWNNKPYQYYDFLNVDLSYFLGRDVIFRISATFEDAADTSYKRSLVLDKTVDNGKDDPTETDDNAWPGLGLVNAPFGFGFFNYEVSTGGSLYFPGAISDTDLLDDGAQQRLLYYSLTLPGKYIEDLINDQQISQFVHAPVPEPMTLLLLGSGLAALAGFRKRIIG